MRSRRMHGQSPHILSEAPQAVPRLIWAKAEGCRVWDAQGRAYIDLTGGFGVAALGHRNSKIAAAIAEAPVVHALGDLAEAEVTQALPRRVALARQARHHR